MLQRIRDNASGPLAYVVVALITLVFGVWGIGSYFTPSSDPVVASVGDTDITRYQLQRAYDQRYQRLRQLMGDNFDPNLVPPQQLRRTVLQGLVNDAVVDQYAQAAGYRITDAGLLAAIRSDPQFQVDGQFSAQRYRALLAQAGVAAAQYEAGLRNDLKSQQLRREIVGSAFAAPAEVDQAYRLVNQQRRVRFLRFDPANYSDQVEITADQIKRFYQENPDQFQRPERVKLAYVELSRANAEAGAEPDAQSLRALYDQNKAQLGTPEKRDGAQIRVPISGAGDGARATVQKLAGALDGNTDLEAAAANAGGDVEYSRIDGADRRSLPTAVADTLFDMDKGTVSSPVRGEDAWYLLRLDDVMPASTPAFDDPEVQTQLKSIASAQQANAAYRDKTERLEALAFEAPNDLKTLVDELDLEIQHSDWLTREQGTGLGQYDAIRKAAFSDAVYKDKLNSTPIQLGSDRRVVLRVDERQAAQRRPLEAVRDQIETRLATRQASEKAQDAARQALERLRSGATMAALASDEGATLESPGYIRRSNTDVDARVRDAAFSVAKPGADAARYQITPTSQGMVALVAVDGVRQGDSDDTATPRRQLAQQQREYIAGLEYAAFNAYLRNGADIEIYENLIN